MLDKHKHFTRWSLQFSLVKLWKHGLARFIFCSQTPDIDQLLNNAVTQIWQGQCTVWAQEQLWVHRRWISDALFCTEVKPSCKDKTREPHKWPKNLFPSRKINCITLRDLFLRFTIITEIAEASSSKWLFYAVNKF